jgi:hypothetical protein
MVKQGDHFGGVAFLNLRNWQQELSKKEGECKLRRGFLLAAEGMFN